MSTRVSTNISWCFNNLASSLGGSLHSLSAMSTGHLPFGRSVPLVLFLIWMEGSEYWIEHMLAGTLNLLNDSWKPKPDHEATKDMIIQTSGIARRCWYLRATNTISLVTKCDLNRDKACYENERRHREDDVDVYVVNRGQELLIT